MKVRLSELREFLRQALLEYNISPKATLYHRSIADFKPGTILTARKRPETGQHWLASREHERKLEEYRTTKHPELPSRFECVYGSFHPRSRFLDKGKLYAIQPIGRTFTTNSNLIDEIKHRWDDEREISDLVAQYWEGVEPERANIFITEVLMDSARVIELVEERGRFTRGTKFKLGPQSPVFKCVLNVYNNGSEFYSSDGNTALNIDKLKDASSIPGLKIQDPSTAKVSEWGMEGLNVELHPGFEGIVCQTNQGSDPGEQRFKRAPNASVSPGDEVGSTGMSLNLKPSAAEFIKALQSGKIERR